MKSTRTLRAPWPAVLALLLPFATTAMAIETIRPLPERPPIPNDNRQTAEKIELGRLLYFDPRLSFTGVMSCNSCHVLSRGGVDGLRVSVGALGQPARRNTPTVWNVAFQPVYFLDGRAATLEQAIVEHLRDPAVMAMPNEATVTGRLEAIAAYRRRFAAAFPRSRAITGEQVAQALASFLRTRVTPNTPFDRYLRGDRAALSEAAQRGLREFSESGCADCHFRVNSSGPAPGLEPFPNHVGSRHDARYDLLADAGRYQADGREEHRHLWRLPTLRNIARTAPYFHNGAVETLDEAVRVMAETQLLRMLDDRRVADIVAFLESLTGEFPDEPPPDLP